MSRELKDSGIAWIGEIPKGWNICRIKDVICLYTGNSIKDEEKDIYTDKLDAYPYISTKDIDVVYYTINYDNGLYTKKDDILFKNADIGSSLVCIEGGSAGKKKAFVEQKISFVNKLCCFAPKNINGKYSFYHLCSSNFEFQFNKFVTGLIGGVSVSVLKNFIMILPPLLEQQKIAEFLDRKCAEIDELVALQEKMIEELKAYKQSVITEAVTKGLNPNAPMKDSGIEWIGEIPEHWEVKRIKFIGKAENGLTYTPTDVCDVNEGTLVLRSSNIQNGKLVFDDNVYVRSMPESLRVQVGDIIICSRNGSASLVGKSALVENDIDATFGAFMMRFRSNHNCKYINFLLTATISHYKQLFTTTTINQLTIGLINNISMPFINDKIEQQQIADYLDKKCAEIDELVAVKQQKIET